MGGLFRGVLSASVFFCFGWFALDMVFWCLGRVGAGFVILDYGSGRGLWLGKMACVC